MTDPPPSARRTNPSATDQANVVIHPPVLWLLLVAVGFSLNLLAPLTFLPAGFPKFYVGLAVWLVGFILAAIAIYQFRRAGTEVQTHTPTATIVDNGVYAFSRNPIYVGAHIGLAGVAIALNSLWILAMLIPFFFVIRNGVVAREEKYLERKFGDTYLAYKARVRRWL